MTIPEIKLANGREMPVIGFGTWQIRAQACIDSVRTAAEAGYRHFDTAQIYGNEAEVAQGIEQAELSREDVFITTKISIHNFLRAEKSFADSLKKLSSDYVDLLLLHYPVSGVRNQAWKKLEKLQADGQARAIGVSNFTIRHLKQLMDRTSVIPMVNQVELHVFLQQPELRAFCADNGIVVEAYSPLAHGQGMDDPVLKEIADKYDKSPAQIMLRWCLEVGTVPLPKSASPNRILENIDIFDFTLDQDDMRRLQGLERGLRTCWDPTRTP